MDNVSIQFQKIVTVTNPLGLHMRPANMLSRAAAQFESLIQIEKDGQAIDGKSIMGILTLGAQQGTQLHLRAVGPDAQQAIDRIAELFDNGFDEGEPVPSQSG
jgi:phosphocarrier protein HPr